MTPEQADALQTRDAVYRIGYPAIKEIVVTSGKVQIQLVPEAELADYKRRGWGATRVTRRQLVVRSYYMTPEEAEKAYVKRRREQARNLYAEHQRAEREVVRLLALHPGWELETNPSAVRPEEDEEADA